LLTSAQFLKPRLALGSAVPAPPSASRLFIQLDGSKDAQTSSDEGSEAEVEEEEEESDDEFCDRTTAPVSKWEALAGNRAVGVQLCQQLRLD
jgi:hypothetical protein